MWMCCISEAPGDILFTVSLCFSHIVKEQVNKSIYIWALKDVTDRSYTPGYYGYCRRVKLYATYLFL